MAVTEPCSLWRVVALPRSTDSLGTQHCANFESHSNRVTFETNAIMMIVKVHPHSNLKNTYIAMLNDKGREYLM